MAIPIRHAPLRVGLAGLGTVGSGVIRLIQENSGLIARRAGREIEIVAVTARDRTKDRGVDLSPYRWVDDMGELATAADIDVVVGLTNAPLALRMAAVRPRMLDVMRVLMARPAASSLAELMRTPEDRRSIAVV